MIDAPPAHAGAARPAMVLVTDDGSGVAAAFAQALGTLGIHHRVVADAPGTALDLCDPVAVSALVESIRTVHGPITGLVHLMPLAPVTDAQATEFEARTLRDLKSVFLLSKTLEQDLRKSGTVLAATRLGGTFGFRSADFFPGSGAISGFVKTLPREWAEVAARTVDFEAGAGASEVAALLVEELLCRDGLTEIGYPGGHRKTLRSYAASVGSAPSGLNLDRNSVVLVTGGARGITADTSIELAKSFQTRFVLLGRSPLPPSQESPDTAGVTNPRELKAIVMDRMQTGGQRPTPALIEGAVKRIKNEREIRENLAALRALGSEVEYHSVDVCDASAMSALIEGLYQKYGRIDGVVHGAGVIEDKLIGDKTPESFERVVKPKIAGALALVRNLRPDNLQFLVFFSSVSARYGNRGQCDYSAANEVLNKLAESLNAKWPGRVVSMNWGPWQSEGGMVSPELAARFKAAGVELIEPPAGCRAFVAELVHGNPQDVEVVYGGPLTIEQQTPGAAASKAATPAAALPMGAMVTRQPDGSVHALVNINPQQHIFLRDHQLDGKPVLPLVMAMEIFTEVAATAKPGIPVTAVRNLCLLQGVSYTKGVERPLLVESGLPTNGTVKCALDFVLKSEGSPLAHYRGQVELGGSHPPAPPRLKLVNPRPFPLSVPEAYQQWLFHGPMFAGIVEILAMGDNGIIGRLRPSAPRNLIHPEPVGAWLIDPVVADSSLQLSLLWGRAVYDQTALPTRIKAYYQVSQPSTPGEILCEMEIACEPGSPLLLCTPVFYDASGRLLGWMERLEMTMSKALNRLASTRGTHAAQ
jgi:NAD(P)-dependent dehydrogenase (short-subunit alcohol dehydrogenase family)